MNMQKNFKLNLVLVVVLVLKSKASYYYLVQAPMDLVLTRVGRRLRVRGEWHSWLVCNFLC